MQFSEILTLRFPQNSSVFSHRKRLSGRIGITNTDTHMMDTVLQEFTLLFPKAYTDT